MFPTLALSLSREYSLLLLFSISIFYYYFSIFYPKKKVNVTEVRSSFPKKEHLLCFFLSTIFCVFNLQKHTSSQTLILKLILAMLEVRTTISRQIKTTTTSGQYVFSRNEKNIRYSRIVYINGKTFIYMYTYFTIVYI